MQILDGFIKVTVMLNSLSVVLRFQRENHTIRLRFYFGDNLDQDFQIGSFATETKEEYSHFQHSILAFLNELRYVI